MIERVGIPLLVRGSGDVGSAAAIVLFRAGYAAALHDEAQPATSRRGMAFANAVFDGAAALDSVVAQRVETIAELRDTLAARTAIPVVVRLFPEVHSAVPWSAIIDARMRKHAKPGHQRGSAPLTIGLGPNFIAGDNVDLAIETNWGDWLGTVIERGPTLPLDGEPQPLGGVARARFVYSPLAGRFETRMQIGDRVEQSEVVASIGGTSLCAPIGGAIRGLTHDGVPVEFRAKVIEIDPRGDPAAAFGLGVRPRRIAEGVSRAMAHARVPA
jgi:xanthine dehydrogenase accessory factor